ncbi:MAG: PorV/PorQ family protein [Candidatus Cloacimonadota bacterium]|nr:PorV/PorQ family protein [Candidatus Cloacimonadota bacterium]
MKTKWMIIAIAFLLIIPITINAVSQSGVTFLLIEPSSRAGAMGSAYVAQVDDAYAGYWNPGAMAFNRKNQFAWMHTNWFGDVKGIDDMYYEYLGWNKYYEDIGNIGFNLLFITYGEQEEYDEEGTFQGVFSSWEVAPTISYGYQLDQNTGLGISFKFIYSDLAPEGQGETEAGTKGRGMSYAFDFGVKRKNFLLPGFDVGLNLQNVGPNITYINESQSDQLPLNWRMGFSYRILENQLNKFTVNADMNKELTTDDDDAFYQRLFTAWGGDQPIFNFGAEYVYLDLLSLRSGYFYDKAGSIEGFSFGGGIHYTFSEKYKLSIDFAMQPAGELTEYNKTFSAKLEY